MFSLGFFDQAIAAPSMKAALEAWGADSNLFHQGAAKESHDPDVIAATLAKPGVVLRRPVGTDRPFSEHAELPTDLGGGKPTKAAPKSKGLKATKRSSRPVDKAAERKAALAYERWRRERERANDEADRQKERERRQQAVDKAQAALDKVAKLGGTGGLIAIDHQGNITLPFNTAGMYRGYVDPNGKFLVEIY